MAKRAMSFTLLGVEAMRRRLGQIGQGFDNAVEKALRAEAEAIMARSKAAFVPVNVGTLKGSGFVNDVVRKGKDVSVVLGFGGDAEAYALAVHEHPSGASPPSWGDRPVNFKRGGPKYLSKPMDEAVPGMDNRIAKIVDRVP